MVKWSSTTDPHKQIEFIYDEAALIYAVAQTTIVGTRLVCLKQVDSPVIVMT
jgi:hypothetical protein